jgi:hypothetical protein
VRHWFKSYGFATLVVASAAIAGYMAAAVSVPDPVPDFALRAREIYRLQVGSAFFVAFYLLAMAIALALDGRGFAELGTKGLRPEQIIDQTADQQLTLHRQWELDRRTVKRLNDHEKRLEKLEKKSLV